MTINTRKIQRERIKNQAKQTSGKNSENFKRLWAEHLKEERTYVDQDGKTQTKAVNKPKKHNFTDNPKDIINNIKYVRAITKARMVQLTGKEEE